MDDGLDLPTETALTEEVRNLVKKACLYSLLHCVINVVPQVQAALEFFSAFRKQLYKGNLSPDSKSTISIPDLDRISEVSRAIVPIVNDIVGTLDSPLVKGLRETLGRLRNTIESRRSVADGDTTRLASLLEITSVDSYPNRHADPCRSPSRC